MNISYVIRWKDTQRNSFIEKAKEKGKSDVKLSKKVIAIALASIMVIKHPGNDLHIFGIRTEINDRIIDIGPYNQD